MPQLQQLHLVKMWSFQEDVSIQSNLVQIVIIIVLLAAEHVLKAVGKEGPVDIKMKLAGYNQEVLDKVGITNPVRFQTKNTIM